jgi:hypothetical protein
VPYGIPSLPSYIFRIPLQDLILPSAAALYLYLCYYTTLVHIFSYGCFNVLLWIPLVVHAILVPCSALCVVRRHLLYYGHSYATGACYPIRFLDLLNNVLPVLQLPCRFILFNVAMATCLGVHILPLLPCTAMAGWLYLLYLSSPHFIVSSSGFFYITVERMGYFVLLLPSCICATIVL